jgi:hypothetical protein
VLLPVRLRFHFFHGAAMRVRLNIGRRIGEVVEIDYPTAKVMIADGRASDMRVAVSEVAPRPSEEKPLTLNHRRSRRGSPR